jgi:hypothetical protein
VTYEQESSTLAELVAGLSAADEVVIAAGPLETKLFFRQVFPRETHFGTRDTRADDPYEEFATAFEVLELLRPGALKPGDRFWAWDEPAYSLEDVRRYHEEGFSTSPVIMEREPVFPVEGGRLIAVVHCLKDKCGGDFPLVYAIRAEEGLGAGPEIKKLLKARLGRNRKSRFGRR